MNVYTPDSSLTIRFMELEKSTAQTSYTETMLHLESLGTDSITEYAQDKTCTVYSKVIISTVSRLELLYLDSKKVLTMHTLLMQSLMD